MTDHQDEEKITNDSVSSTLQDVHNMCKELLKKQNNIEKSNIEIVDKLRMTNEQLESIKLQLKSDIINEKTDLPSKTPGIESLVETATQRLQVTLCQLMENTLC